MKLSIARTRSPLLLLLVLVQWTAALSFTSYPSIVVPGNSYTLTWTSTGSGPFTLTLKEGPSANLADVGVIASSISSTSYTWTPGLTLASGSDYTIEITQGSDVNYTPIFTVNSGSAASTTTTQPAKTTTTIATAETTTKPSTSSNPSSGTTASDTKTAGTSVSSNSPSSSESSSSATTSGSSSSSTGNTPSAAVNPKSGLSTAAKAGIGVGVAVGVLLLCLAAFLVGRMGFARHAAAANAQVENPPVLEANYGNPAVAQLDGRQWTGAELPTSSNVHEMGGGYGHSAGHAGRPELP